MSDKLNKLGFLAGKLFAKTVSEVKPLLTKDEPSQTSPAQVLSAEEKIKKVLELLETKNVSKNIENLLNRHDFRFDEIVVKQRKYSTSSSINEVEGLNDSLIEELEIKEINKHLHFEYKEKKLHLFIANDASGSFPAGDTYNLCELIVIYNGTCVLKDSISKETDLYGSVYRVGSFHSLKSFKNGSWMDDLNYLIRNFDYFEKLRKSIEIEKKQKQIADKLDLDPLD